MSKYLKLLAGICFSFICSSCSNPYMDDYKDYVEDSFRFQISNESYQKELRSRIYYFDVVLPNSRQRQNCQNHYEDYNTVLSFVYQARNVHTKSTFYRTLEYLYISMESFESSPEKINTYRNIVNQMQVNYNDMVIEMSNFQRIGRNRYLITEQTTGSTCELTIHKNYDIDLNLHINKENL